MCIVLKLTTIKGIVEMDNVEMNFTFTKNFPITKCPNVKYVGFQVLSVCCLCRNNFSLFY